MEIEFKTLQQKVQKLEEALLCMETRTSHKLGFILSEIIANRADQAATQKKLLQDEQSFYQQLLAKCTNWTKEDENNADIEKTKEESILLRSLQAKTTDSQNYVNGAEITTSNSCFVQNRSTSKQPNSPRVDTTNEVLLKDEDVDPISVVTLGYDEQSATEYESHLNDCYEAEPPQFTLNETTVEYPSEIRVSPCRLYDANVDQSEEPYNDEIPWRIRLKSFEDEDEVQQYDSSLVNRLHSRSFAKSSNEPDQNNIIPVNSTIQPSRVKKPNKCKLCPAAFTLKRTLLMHMHSFHKTPRPQQIVQRQIQCSSKIPNTKTDKPQKRLYCKFPKCQKNYASVQNLRIHFRTHTGEKPYVCSICEKAFADPSCLRRHTMYLHGVLHLNGLEK